MRSFIIVLSTKYNYNVEVKVMRWAGHVACMGKKSTTYMIFMGNYRRKESTRKAKT
jgi:hypothetical protein